MRKVGKLPGRMLTAFLLFAAVPGAEGRQSAPAVDRLFRISGSVQPGAATAGYQTLIFGIYEAEQGGAPLWQEVQTVAVDARGQYTVLLGATSADGVPVDLFGSGAPRWLATDVQGGAGVPGPRVLLTSVPYALRAASAGDAHTLAGRPVTDFQLTPAAQVAATSSGADAAAGGREATPRANSGGANYIGKFQNTVDLGNSVMYESAGRIGVGTTTPLDFLHTRFTDASGGFTGLAVQNMSGAASAYSGMLFYDHNGALAQFQGFNNSTKEYRINNVAAGGAITFMLAGTARLRVAPGGNIGMGTISPASPLHVTGAIRTDAQYNVGANRVLATTGTENLFVGVSAGAANSGAQNTFVGNQAGAANSTGAANTFVGEDAGLVNTTGASNTFVGENAGDANIGGSFGTFVGQAAGGANTSGADNTFVGQAAGGSSTSGGANTFLGRNAGFANTTAANSTFVGASAGMNSSGASNTFVGQTAGDANTMGTQNTLLGAGADVASGSLTNATAIGAFASVAQSNSLVLGSITGLNGAAANTSVGIGTTTPQDRLHVAGDIRIGAGTTGCVKDADATVIAGTCASDLRFKTNVQPFGAMLAKVAGLTPVTFGWRTADFPERGFGARLSYGLIAQEVEQVLPDLVVTDAQGYRAVNYSRLPLITIQAVKELKAENDVLRAQNADLTTRLEAIERALREFGIAAPRQ
jgi:Chaperone of endosialidase